jgi:hypothetical protein
LRENTILIGISGNEKRKMDPGQHLYFHDGRNI